MGDGRWEMGDGRMGEWEENERAADIGFVGLLIGDPP